MMYQFHYPEGATKDQMRAAHQVNAAINTAMSVAEAAGLVFTVELLPLQPPAMGNHYAVLSFRPVRNPAPAPAEQPDPWAHLRDRSGFSDWSL